MIIFVGVQSRGYFLTETAKRKGEKVTYVTENLSILKQRDQILQENGEYIIFDIEQYTDASDVLADEIRKLVRAKGWKVIVYAPGYDPDSRIIKELQLQGLFILFSQQILEKREWNWNGVCRDTMTIRIKRSWNNSRKWKKQ